MYKVQQVATELSVPVSYAVVFVGQFLSAYNSYMPWMIDSM
jgi:hypothetical protein